MLFNVKPYKMQKNVDNAETLRIILYIKKGGFAMGHGCTSCGGCAAPKKPAAPEKKPEPAKKPAKK